MTFLKDLSHIKHFCLQIDDDDRTITKYDCTNFAAYKNYVTIQSSNTSKSYLRGKNVAKIVSCIMATYNIKTENKQDEL